MAPRIKKVLKGFKKGIPEGKLKSFPPIPSTQKLQGVSTGLLRSFLVHPRAKTSAQLADTARNLPSQANKGLQNTPIRNAVPKGVSVLKGFGGTFKRQFSRLRRVVR
jgi:hypothetical protein